MSLNLTELKDEPLGLAPTSADFCVPGTCFVELRDEPLDDSPSVSAAPFVPIVPITCFSDGRGDEALDDSPSVECFVPSVCLPGSGFCYVDKDMDTPTADTRMVCTLTGIGTSDA